MRSMCIGGLAVTKNEVRSVLPPLVLVHGMWEKRQYWWPWQLVMASKGMSTIAVDLRGHGESACTDIGKVRVRDHAEDIDRVLREIGPAIIVGHSMGGLVGQVVASENALVQKLALVATALPSGIRVLRVRTALRLLRYLPAIALSREFIPHWKDILVLELNCLENAERYRNQIEPDSGTVLRETAFGLVRVGRHRCPVWCAIGKHDRIVPPNGQLALAERLEATVKIYEGGHMLPIESISREVANDLAEWILKHCPD